jgi:hypothetical protein
MEAYREPVARETGDEMRGKGASMRKALLFLGSAGLLAACLLTLPAGEAQARVWKDCQRIAKCSGCQPVFRCRSCEYRRSCAGGVCGWGDICVWGPYVKVLPRGARIINR